MHPQGPGYVLCIPYLTVNVYFISLPAGYDRPRRTKEIEMRMWAFTVALFLGMVTWAVDTLGTIVPDQQTVTAMEDPLGPPPKP
jgi:hypothetical protein